MNKENEKIDLIQKDIIYNTFKYIWKIEKRERYKKESIDLCFKKLWVILKNIKYPVCPINFLNVKYNCEEYPTCEECWYNAYLNCFANEKKLIFAMHYIKKMSGNLQSNKYNK